MSRRLDVEMELNLQTLTFALMAGFGGWYWWRAMGTKECAVRAARQACKRADVMLLDQSVYLSGLGWQRDGRGRICLRRTYGFDFTATGDNRYRGRITLLGQIPQSVEFEPHRFE